MTGKAAEVTRIKPPDSAGSFGACSSSSQESVTGIFEEEEIFEQDGYIEEIIAVDYPDRSVCCNLTHEKKLHAAISLL